MSESEDIAPHADGHPGKTRESEAFRLAKLVTLRRMREFWISQIALGDDATHESVPPGLAEAINRPVTDEDIRNEARLLDEEWGR